jgi:hypothetical protein
LGAQRGRRGAIYRVLALYQILGEHLPAAHSCSAESGAKEVQEFLLLGVRGYPSIPYLFSPKSGGPGG